jgi:hypothetical protein
VDKCEVCYGDADGSALGTEDARKECQNTAGCGKNDNNTIGSGPVNCKHSDTRLFDLKYGPPEIAGATFGGKYHVPSLRDEKR